MKRDGWMEWENHGIAIEWYITLNWPCLLNRAIFLFCSCYWEAKPWRNPFTFFLKWTCFAVTIYNAEMWFKDGQKEKLGREKWVHLVSHLVPSFFLLLFGIYQRGSLPQCLECKCSRVPRSGQEALSRWWCSPSLGQKRILNCWWVLWVHIAVSSHWLSAFFPHSLSKDLSFPIDPLKTLD